MTEASEACLDALTLYRLRLPLARPYHLSFGDLEAFETILVRARCGSLTAWGETTPLTGYSQEDVEGVWRRDVEWSRAIVGLSLGQGLDRLEAWAAGRPFARTPLATAIEQLIPWGGTGGGVPGVRAVAAGDPAAVSASLALIGTIGAARPEGIEGEVGLLLAAGYTRLKLKVGVDVDRDLANVRAAQRALGMGACLRLDANQGYGPDEARRFVAALDPEGIELFEQPFPAERWDWTAALGRSAPVPLMLDESIGDEADVECASRTPGVRYVKLKLMKCGSCERLRRLFDRARSLGLGVVVGNGVASDVGCLHEAWAVAGRLELAGEMNGFLKPVVSLLAEPLRVERGRLLLPPAGGAAAVRSDVLDRFGVDGVTV